MREWGKASEQDRAASPSQASLFYCSYSSLYSFLAPFLFLPISGASLTSLVVETGLILWRPTARVSWSPHFCPGSDGVGLKLDSHTQPGASRHRPGSLRGRRGWSARARSSAAWKPARLRRRRTGPCPSNSQKALQRPCAAEDALESRLRQGLGDQARCIMELKV